MKARARVRTKIRKAAKWGGAAVTVLLLVVWIGSGWWFAGVKSLWNKNRVDVDARHGSVGVVWARPVHAFGPRFIDWEFERLSKDESGRPLRWFFRHERPTPSQRALTIVVIPLWLPLVIVLGGTSLVWRADLRATRRARVGLCAACGYDLSGTAAGAVCPECGRAKQS